MTLFIHIGSLVRRLDGYPSSATDLNFEDIVLRIPSILWKLKQ